MLHSQPQENDVPAPSIGHIIGLIRGEDLDRTSALLGRLAEDYRSDANREDVDVRKR